MTDLKFCILALIVFALVMAIADLAFPADFSNSPYSLRDAAQLCKMYETIRPVPGELGPRYLPDYGAGREHCKDILGWWGERTRLPDKSASEVIEQVYRAVGPYTEHPHVK